MNEQDKAFQAITQKYNYTSPVQSNQSQDWYSQVQNKVKGQTVDDGSTKTENFGADGKIVGGIVGSMIKPVESFGKEIGASIGANKDAKKVESQNQSVSDNDLANIKNLIAKKNEMKASGQNTSHIMDFIKNYKTQSGQSLAELYPAVNDTNEQVVGNALGTLLAATSGGALSTGAEGVTGTFGKALATGAKVGGTYGAVGGVGNAMSENADTHDVVGAGLKGGAVGALAGAGTEGVLYGATHLPEIEQGVKDLKDKVIGGKSNNPVQDSIDAVNPDLTGKKLTGAYKQVVTGNRDTVPSSIFKEQGLTPSEQTTNLGTRLSDLGLGKDPVENLNKLSTALEDTETKVTTELEKNPEIPTERDTLLENLDKGKTEAIPREFKGIKDSSKAFQDVIDFAKENIDSSPDNFKGLREARTSFDTQAKVEYPNAYKDGTIDIKTPAGRAIKFVRDTMNKHLYETAPNGSEIQKLIGREADIFKATDSIAPKAAATHGQTGLEQAIDKHPIIKAGVNTVKRAIPYGIGSHLP